MSRIWLVFNKPYHLEPGWVGEEVALVESAYESSKMADAGEQKRLGIGDTFRSSTANRFRAETLESTFNGSSVAGAVIDESDFHRRPFVLGKTLRRRLSRDTAKRRARAKALNSASIW